VAPPERTARSGTASVLPPAPTVSSSHVRINHETALLTLYVFFVSSCVCINCEQGCGWGEEWICIVCFFFVSGCVCIDCEQGCGWGEEWICIVCFFFPSLVVFVLTVNRDVDEEKRFARLTLYVNFFCL
jgi:hypothetical protein